MAVRQPGLRPLNKTGYVMALPLRGGRAFFNWGWAAPNPCALFVLYDFAPSITLSSMLQGLSFTHSGRFLRKVPDPGGPLMRTSIIGARPPQSPCALFVLYDFAGHLCASATSD